MSHLSRPGSSISIQRAKKALREAGFTQREIAKQLGIDETKLSKTLAGTRRFTRDELDKFTALTGVTQQWLSESEDHAGETLPSMRQRLLTVAWELFATHGYEKVRIADIAQAAGVSAATVIYHFNAKPAIYLACLEQVTEDSKYSAAEILDGDGSSFEKLYQLTSRHLPDEENTRRQWAVWLQFWGSTPTYDDIKTATQSAYSTWYDTVIDLVAAAQHDGWLPEEPHLADVLTALIDGLGIRIMSGLMTPDHARSILHEFYTARLLEPHPL